MYICIYCLFTHVKYQLSWKQLLNSLRHYLVLLMLENHYGAGHSVLPHGHTCSKLLEYVQKHLTLVELYM